MKILHYRHESERLENLKVKNSSFLLQSAFVGTHWIIFKELEAAIVRGLVKFCLQHLLRFQTTLSTVARRLRIDRFANKFSGRLTVYTSARYIQETLRR